MEFWHSKWGSQRKLGLDKASRDALADVCRQRWPSGTAKLAAREWGLTVDEARGVVAGRCSFTTYDKVVKRPGGFLVGLRVLEAVTGQSVAHFFSEQLQLAAKANQNAEQNDHLARTAWGRLADAADHCGNDREGAAPVGETRRGFRALGVAQARRLGGGQ